MTTTVHDTIPSPPSFIGTNQQHADRATSKHLRSTYELCAGALKQAERALDRAEAGDTDEMLAAAASAMTAWYLAASQCEAELDDLVRHKLNAVERLGDAMQLALAAYDRALRVRTNCAPRTP
jgi:hypothetical protein